MATHTQQLSYTATIATKKTVAEVQQLLSSHGATAVMVEDDQGDPVAMKLKIIVDNEPLGYRLLVNWQEVLAVMRRDALAW